VEASCVLEALRSSHALTPSRNHALRCCGGASVVRRVCQNLHWVAQFSLAEKKERLAARVVRTTVVGGLGGHVGKINPLIEHVSVERKIEVSTVSQRSHQLAV
jgi:hypothetical protein